MSALTDEQLNAIRAGLRLLQAFSDCDCVVTLNDQGSFDTERMEDIAAIADDSGMRLANDDIDELCEAIDSCSLFFGRP